MLANPFVSTLAYESIRSLKAKVATLLAQWQRQLNARDNSTSSHHLKKLLPILSRYNHFLGF